MLLEVAMCEKCRVTNKSGKGGIGGYTNSNFFFGGVGTFAGGQLQTTLPPPPIMPCHAMLKLCGRRCIYCHCGNRYGIPNSHLNNILRLHPEDEILTAVQRETYLGESYPVPS